MANINGKKRGQAAIERTPSSARTLSVRGQAAIDWSSTSARPLSMRGQAAMEYLMTYGWALLVIALVITILVLFLPTTPSTCRFDMVGFTCDLPAFANVGGNTSLYLTIYNGNNNNIRINSTYCTADKTSESPNIAIPASSTLVTRQGNYTIIASPCYRNGVLMGATTAGSDFSGKLWVFYRNEEDPSNSPLRVVSATISGKVSR